MSTTDKLLNDTEAAILLGITKELLYAYVRNAPKTALQHTRKLPSRVIAGKNYFIEKDLLDFDAYLQEPWSDPNEPRPAIPKYIEEYLKTEIGGKCPITGKGYPLDNAHIVAYAESLNHHHHNLVRVAKEAHTKADNAVIARQLLRETKDRLIEKMRHQLRIELIDTEISCRVPHPHQVFIGREEQLEKLTEAIKSERFTVIAGLGGIGKTELLLNALKNTTWDRPVLWIDIETVGSVSDLKVLLINQLAQLEGQQTGASLVEVLSGKPVTLVFDSLEKLLLCQREEMEAFIKTLLTQTVDVKIIATSQVDLSLIDYPKKVIELEGLGPYKSIQLLEALLVDQPKITGEELTWLLEFCNGHPLSLKLVVSLFVFYKSAEAVVAQLKKTGSLKHPMLKKHNKSNALDICLSAIYEILTEEQKSALQYLQFFPGGINLRLSGFHTAVAEFSTTVAMLMQFYFIERKEDRIFLVNPVRPFLKGVIQDKTSIAQLQKAAILHLLYTTLLVNNQIEEFEEKEDLSMGYKWIDDELLNLLEAFRIAQAEVEMPPSDQNKKSRDEYLKIIVDINEALRRYFFSRGLFEFGILLDKAALKANIEQNDIEKAADNFLSIVSIQTRQDDLEGFTKTLGELKELAERTGNLKVRIKATRAQAQFELKKENYKAAITLFKDALCLLGETKNDRESNYYVIHVKSEIANTYWLMGEAHEAIIQFDAILPSIEKYFSEDDVLAILNSYGNCLCEAGREEEGFGYLFKAIEGFKKIGLAEYIGSTIWSLGLHIEKYPELAAHPSLDETAFVMALEGLRQSISAHVKRLSAVHGKSWAINHVSGDLTNKLLYIMKVVCLTSYDRVLLEWAVWMIYDLEISMHELNAFSLTLSLCNLVAGATDWKDSAELAPQVTLSIMGNCALLNGDNGLESPGKMFQWLALWMRYAGLDTTATAESLWEKAKFLQPVNANFKTVRV